MSDDANDSCECVDFYEGDWVESRLNTSVFGIIVGESDFGRYYHVQLAGTLEMKPFHAVTLRHRDAPNSPPQDADEVEPTETAEIIDFTKARDLRLSSVQGRA